MLSALFVCERHENYGELGLRMRNRPHFEPLTGMAVAHDLLEHFRNDDGRLSGELMALGASIHVRDGENYHTRRGNMNPVHKHLAADMVQQVYYTEQSGDRLLRDCGRTARLPDDYAEYSVQEALKSSIRLLRTEVAADQFPSWLTGDEQRRRFVGWLRRGYRAAQRRYRGIPSYTLMEAFIAVERAADNFLKYAEEGMEVRISVDPHRARAVLEERYND